ncbi:glutathione S-transferase family protein [Nostoc sp. CHAB 5844]|nr:glutathione S-transferase family protein [Nostoc sp. CHAB 5844]
MALGRLVNGQWTTVWTERNENGEFQRMPTQFHHQITADGASGFRAEAGRYHLYVSLGCPWAHRTVLLRALKGLEKVIGLSIVDPVISNQGWKFSDKPGCIRDKVNQADYLWQIYTKANPNYTGRVTVPVLWDKHTQTIINNESRQIIQILNTEFNFFAEKTVDFYPKSLQTLIDETIDAIYQPINNGVYRTGFAASQTAYEQALKELFLALEYWEKVLGKQPYLCGEEITLVDWCLFTTLFRFDLAYYGLFKCNLKRLVDHPNLWNYCRELYQFPGVKQWCNISHIKQLYYLGLSELNPNGIVPVGPIINFDLPYNRRDRQI